ncbi:MAG: competence/damage-inducible protein A [Bacteroidota bacterium]
MNVEIISIGDELLIGQVVNTNASWMATELNLSGFNVNKISTISDKKQAIIQSIDEAFASSDIILITGGLGPTNDDITKYTLCEYFDSKLIFNEESYENINRLFATRGFVITELNRKQAEVPDKCKVIINKNGTAPGMWFQKDGKVLVSMPGVPFEMKAMMSESVIPELTKNNKSKIVHHTILTTGAGESFLADLIKDWEAELPEHINLAYLPQAGIVRLRLSAYGFDKNKLEEEIALYHQKLNKLIPDLIFGYDDDTLQSVIGKILKAKSKTLATAESCTGGYIAHLITSIAGSSDYFKGSVVSYANEIKTDVLGVKQDTLINYGAVSEQTVAEMAFGAIALLKTDYAIAISGIAGPDGGTNEKPVGTVWIAIAYGQNVSTKKFQFGNHRGRNIELASNAALNILRKELLK